ncbi:peroxiredoxin family protein [Rubritalea squalenifaciens]|nr:redoxin domain-containing protein [Rubritalea squalenifaciens]
MNKIVQMTGAVLLGAHVLYAQEAAEKPPANAEASEIKAESIQGIINEYEAENRAVLEKFRAAKTREERNKLFNSRPDKTEYGKRIMKLAEANPKSEESAKGLLWVATQGTRETRQKASDLLIQEHADTETVLSYARYLAGGYGGTPEILTQVVESSTKPKIKRGAQYYLASFYVKNADRQQDEAVAKQQRDKAKALLTELIEEEKKSPLDAGTLAQLETKLMQLEQLVVGGVAPDIVGTDQDDQEFKLSDYRGKVVLLDFWGYW